MPKISLARRLKKATLGSLIAILALSTSIVAAPAAHAVDERGLSTGMPVYVWHGDPYLDDLQDPYAVPVPPEVVILNIDNGNSNWSVVDDDADALRDRLAANGEHVKVIGYVDTAYGTRSMNDVEDSIDGWLAERNSAIHFDGIFVDQVTSACGPTTNSTTYRDYYRTIREYVWSKLPYTPDLVVNNVGTAVSECYLEEEHDTADIFTTFEGTAAAYFQVPSSGNGWVGYTGGNIIRDNAYVVGNEYPSWRFWHIIHTASSNQNEDILDTAFDRWAGIATVTDDVMANPYDEEPSFLNDTVDYASTLSEE